MEFIEKLKLILFAIIYDDLNLQEKDKYFVSLGITPKKIINNYNINLTSQYFFLKNEVHLENITFSEQQYLHSIIDNSPLEIAIQNKELIDFLNRNKFKLLLINTDQKYILWDNNLEHMSPSDAIVLDFHYLKFNDDLTEESEILLYDCLNSIQKNAKYKVSIFVNAEELTNSITLN